LLSQDEFFRHLNLRSVHATSAKYHYRQALKERLRASSQSQSLTPPGSGNKKNIVKKEIIPQTKSPVLTPVKWLTPRKRRKMFGRPKIRSEKRKILDFDNNKLNVIKEESNNNSNQRLLVNGFLKFKCDICNRKFEKRTRMIRHIKNMHSMDIHRVDLSKFVLPKKFQQLHPWSLIEL